MADRDDHTARVAVVGGVLLALWLLLQRGSAPTGATAYQLGATALARRCLVRIDADGITVDGTPVVLGELAARCAATGAFAAEVLATGDARQGTLDAALDQLTRAGIAVHQRAR